MKKRIKSVICLLLCICMLLPSAAFVSSAASLGQVKNLKVSQSKTTSVTIKWSSVSGAKGYKVYLYNSSSGKWVYNKSTTKTSCTVTDLTSAKTYKLKVRAYKGSDKKTYGAYSEEIKTATLPKKVSSLSATNINTNNITLNWKSVSRATGYKIFVYDKSSSSWKKVGTTTSTNSRIVGLASGQTYKFKVRAYYNNGSKDYNGSYSSILTVAAKPQKVSGFKVDGATDKTVTFKWNKVNGATEYQLYKYVDNTWKKLTTTSSTSVTVSADSTAYKYKVRASVVLSSMTVNGDFSDQLTAAASSSASAPAAPTNLRAAAESSNNRIKLTWNSVAGATGYQVAVYDYGTGNYTAVGTTTSTTYYYTTKNSSNYHFKVRSYTTSGSATYYSDYSEAVTIDYTSSGDANDTSLSNLERYGILGYMYDFKEGCFYNTVDAIHRVAGFTPIYDTFAPFAICFYDTVRIDFSYGNLDWRLQLWKGQYGWCFIGGEAGLYTKNPTVNQSQFYSCASDENMLPMSMVVYHNGKKLFTRPYANYWWCTGYVVGVIPGAVVGRVVGNADTSSLKLLLRVTLRNESMRKVVCDGLDKAGFVKGQSYMDSDKYTKAYIYVGNDVFLKWI